MPTLFTLFDIFSANLELYRKEHRSIFICPLCLDMFSRDRILSLSKAHIIPQLLGGKEWTLTCKACNNKVGTEIESCEAERAKFNWALSGKDSELTRAEIWYRNKQNEFIGPVQAEMRNEVCGNEKTLHLYGKERGSNPTAWKLYNESMSSPTAFSEQWTTDIRFQETRSSKRANLTYVHIAYLYMFHQFGYEWIFTPGAEFIRKQIMSPDEPILLPLSPRLQGINTSDDELAIILVAEPADFRSFIVVLPLFRGWSERYGVWMPVFGHPYGQPPQRKNVIIEPIEVPKYHHYLNKHDSYNQGNHFVQKHIIYDH